MLSLFLFLQVHSSCPSNQPFSNYSFYPTLNTGLGNIIWIKLQRHFLWSSKKTLLIQASLYLLLPLYGCIGFFTQKGTFGGVQNKFEILPLAAYHGFLLGATQSTCRVLYASLIPATHESQFFSLYELTDKGSAWVGPLVAAALTTATGTLRSSFVFLAGLFVVGILVFLSVDVELGQKQAALFVETHWTLERKKSGEGRRRKSRGGDVVMVDQPKSPVTIE